MSRKTQTDVADEQETTDPVASEETDLHGFWDRDRSEDEHDEAFALVVDAEGDAPIDAESLDYLGSVTQIEADELTELAEWAEAKACRVCRRAIVEHHDPARLKHEECRTALRAARILRRYQ